MAAFDARIDRALAALVARLGEARHAMVVTHGGVIWSLVARALGFRRKRRPVTRLVNTSLTTLEVDGRASDSRSTTTRRTSARTPCGMARASKTTRARSRSSRLRPGSTSRSRRRAGGPDAIAGHTHEIALTPEAVRATVEQLVSLGPDAPGLARRARLDDALARRPQARRALDYNVVIEEPSR